MIDRILDVMLSRGLLATEDDVIAVIEAMRDPTEDMYLARPVDVPDREVWLRWWEWQIRGYAKGLNMTRRIQTLDGLPVYDATEPLVIEVIKDDIHARDRKNPEKCALARACTRELHVDAKAYLSRLYVKHGDHWLRYQLPETIRSEVASFDRGGGFSQGTYRIPPLPPAARSGSPSQGGKGKGTHSTPRKPPSRTHRQVEGLRAYSPLFGGAIEPGGRK